MIKYFAKKWLVSQINGVLEKYKDDVSKAGDQISTWIGRLLKIIDVLNRVNDRVKDGAIDDQEIDDSVSDVEEIIKAW